MKMYFLRTIVNYIQCLKDIKVYSRQTFITVESAPGPGLYTFDYNFYKYLIFIIVVIN